MAASKRVRIIKKIRQDSGDWLLHDTAGLDRQLTLASLNISVPLSEIFANITFERVPIRAVRPLKT